MHYPLPDKKTLALILIILSFAVAIVAAAVVSAEAMENDNGNIISDIVSFEISAVEAHSDTKEAGGLVIKPETETENSTEKESADSDFSFQLLGDTEMEWTCGRFFVDPGFAAVDADGNDLSHLVTVESELKLWKTGEQCITYSLTDENGKVQKLVRKVLFVPAELPETVQTEKTVYLTFDDGPCTYTMRVLDLLDQYGAKATFFVVAGANPYWELVNEIVARGHSLAIHSSSHEYGKIYSSEEAFFNDILAVQERIFASTGEYASVSRFPGGSATARAYCNAHVDGGFEVIEQGLANMGIRYYDWNIQTESPDNSPSDSINRFIYGVPQFETPISLQHDTALFSVNALEGILNWCVENGYSFGVIDSTTPEVHSKPYT